MFKKIFLMVMLLVFVLPVFAQEAEVVINQLDTAAQESLVEREIPGAAVAYIKNGEVVWIQGYGYGDLEAQTEITPETQFNVASIGKAVTAWAILHLVEEGKLDLDAPVSQYLTRWQLPESEFDADGVTIRRILSHTAGLSVEGYHGIAPDEPLPTVEEQLLGLGANNDPAVELVAEPGTEFSYSGGGYLVLQLVIEEVTGETFADYMQTAIFEPLGMTDSHFEITEDVESASATPYDEDGAALSVLRFTAQAPGGLHMSTADLATFVAAHMEGPNGEPVGRDVISPESVALLGTPMEATDDHYGMGYFIHPLNRRRDTFAVWHDAFNFGWRGMFAVMPTQNEGIVILTNSENGYELIVDVICGWTRVSETDLGNYCQTMRAFKG